MRNTLLLLAAAPLSLLAAATASAQAPEIVTSDVERFYAIYDAAGGKPTAEQLQRDYLDKGTPGLAEFAKMRRITGERIAEAIAKTPEVYVEARQCVALLPAVKARLDAAMAKLSALYPRPSYPPVTLAIGRTRPVGTANATGVMIGLEALCATDAMNPDPEDRFVHVLAHEYGHVLQPAAQVESPDMTVLFASLIEGGAELVAEVISGSVGNLNPLLGSKGREAELETAFLADIDEKALGSKWLYNGLGTPEWPGDLGYWVGYRITKAYYQKAADKKAAIREIIEIEDPKAFLEKSGWTPGMALD